MSDGILLKGLDGSNPLAFLAALGTLRMLTLALPDERVTMAWENSDGAWRPRASCSLSRDGDALITRLDDQLRQAIDRACFAIGDNLNLPAAEFRAHLVSAVKQPEALHTDAARVDADFLAAFGSEVIADDEGLMADTALRTMSGAGHQHFLKFMREIVAKTDTDHLSRTLLLPWDYADEGRGLNLRWDPLDDRRYALRWDDPSTNPGRTMRGANRLAIEALPLLPTVPTTDGLATTAFDGRGARETRFTWPIWRVPLTLPVVGSLLGQVPALRDQPARRHALGVRFMYASYRITTGKYRNFTPAEPT